MQSPTDDRFPAWGTLENDYQILTELHRSGDSRTYLARHLALNRDVTITMVRPPSGSGSTGDHNSLTHFAADARALTVLRHPNLIPVIEGRWLDDGAFAIVRARVRGSTLGQLVNTAGPMPLPRVATTLEQVQSVLEWARTNNVVHRYVSEDALVFQQGSGRVLLALDPVPLRAGALPDACDDAATIGRLAYEMLSGHRRNEPRAPALADVRPGLPAHVIEETDALIRCDRGAPPRNVAAYIASLAPLGAAVEVAMPAAAASTMPAGPSDEPAVIIVKRPYGFGARVATAVAVIAILGVLGVLLRQRSSSDEIGSTLNDTSSLASGDIALHPGDTAIVDSPPAPMPQQPVIVSPIPTPETQPMAPLPQQVAPPASIPPTVIPLYPINPIAPPTTRRHEPGITPPIVRMPAPTPPVSLDTLVTKPAITDAACDAPDAADQRACLSAAIERNDGPLNAVYQRLISALRRRANAQPGDPDPPSVEQLRVEQRKWMNDREAACRDVGDGPVYARVRAQCLADWSPSRVRELEQMLRANTQPSDTTGGRTAPVHS